MSSRRKKVRFSLITKQANKWLIIKTKKERSFVKKESGAFGSSATLLCHGGGASHASRTLNIILCQLTSLNATYQKAIEEKFPDATQNVPFDASIWADTIGASTRGRVYGFGSSHPSEILGDAYSSQSTRCSIAGCRGIGSFGSSSTDEEIERIIEQRMEQRMDERVQDHVRIAVEHMKKQLEDSQQIQLQQMFNQHMAHQALFMMRPQAPFVAPCAHQFENTSGSSFPAPGQLYPQYGMYGTL